MARNDGKEGVLGKTVSENRRLLESGICSKAGARPAGLLQQEGICSHLLASGGSLGEWQEDKARGLRSQGNLRVDTWKNFQVIPRHEKWPKCIFGVGTPNDGLGAAHFERQGDDLSGFWRMGMT